MSNPIVPMFDMLRNVAVARCRVVKWRMTEPQAYDVAEYLERVDNRSRFETLDIMKRGECVLLGARVEVRA